MIKVQYTATVYNPDTEETLHGWVDPQYSMWTLFTLAEDVRTFEYETEAEAFEAIESEIGLFETGDRQTFYALDARKNNESGEDWLYAAHIEK